jgi:hypothetical protein
LFEKKLFTIEFLLITLFLEMFERKTRGGSITDLSPAPQKYFDMYEKQLNTPSFLCHIFE